MKEIKDLKKEDCEQLLSYATDKEKEMYRSFGDNWQMGLVMSGIWANYSHTLEIVPTKEKPDKKPNKTVQEEPEKETSGDEEEQDQIVKTNYNIPTAYVPKKNIENPDFNFADEYSLGQTVFLVKCFPSLSKYEVLKLRIRSIYNRLMVGTVESGYCECIGYEMKDNVFLTELAGKEYLEDLKIKFPPKRVTIEKMIEEEEDSNPNDPLEALADTEE